jgi:DNA processing protein
MPLSPSALEPLLRLAVVPGIGPARLHALVRRFGSAERVLAASPGMLGAVPGLGPELVRRVLRAAEPAGLQRAKRAMEMLEAHHAVALTPDDLEYPEGFRRLADPPFLLFAAGDRALLHAPSVALVGTRRPSPYGRAAADGLARGLVAVGYAVVSGLARGIDTAAHEAALAAGGGTVGVLGHGVERVYPAENRALFREIAERGLLVTEYAPGEEPKAGNFPRRNRLIAALSRGVVVVEMTLRSGARHTVDAALDLGCEVFAVPGPIGTEASEGTNLLIKHGAALVTGVADIVEALEGVGGAGPAPRPATARREPTPAPLPADLPPGGAELLRAMDGEPRHIDRLAAEAALAPGEALAALLHLELMGLAESLPGKLFRRR